MRRFRLLIARIENIRLRFSEQGSSRNVLFKTAGEGNSIFRKFCKVRELFAVFRFAEEIKGSANLLHFFQPRRWLSLISYLITQNFENVKL